MKKIEYPLIRSAQNRRIKDLLQLGRKRERSRTGLIVIEGVREIERSLEGGVDIRSVFFCPSLAVSDPVRNLLRTLAHRGAEMLPVNKKVYEKIAYRENTGGIVLTAERPSSTLEELRKESRPFYLVADRIEKPGNQGAIFRSADGAGVSAVLISGAETDIYNPNVIRASLGTVFTVSRAAAQTADLITWLKERNITIIISTPAAEMLYTEADLTSSCAAVVGSEDSGVDDLWLRAADLRVRIPMRGTTDSLNVSVSAAILAYEALRQRGIGEEGNGPG
ncbi:MAG: RNA methyltransferase [Candidatus Krumholzibacteriota bacterium]|nr:RNA methyltransferase [Candidatus Krumholzibacteriota bacterium]